MSTTTPRPTIPALEMEVADVLHPGVLSVPPGTDARSAASVMVANEIHAIVVAGAQPSVVTDLDVLAAALGAEPLGAASQLTTPLPVVTPRAPLGAAIDAMAAAGVTHALVGTHGELPAGMLSGLDVAAVVSGRSPRIARMVRAAVAQPALSERRLDRVNAARAMHPGVVGVTPSTPLRDIAAILADRRVHAVAVAGVSAASARERLVWSVVTDLDMLRAIAAGDLDATAAQVAGNAPPVSGLDDGLHEVAEALVELGARHAVVADAAGKPVGIVSTLDILRVLAVGAWPPPRPRVRL